MLNDEFDVTGDDEMDSADDTEMEEDEMDEDDAPIVPDEEDETL